MVLDAMTLFAFMAHRDSVDIGRTEIPLIIGLMSMVFGA